MNDKSVVKSITTKVIIILLASLIIGSFLTENKIALLKGLFLGGIFTILKLRLMEITFSKAVKKPPEAAKRYASIHYILRYILTFLVLVVGVLEPSINVIGVIIGLISMKLAVFWHGYKQPPTPKDGSVTFNKWEDEDENSDF